ncbi:MAG: Fic family protein [Pseudomonadota bacterium]
MPDWDADSGRLRDNLRAIAADIQATAVRRKPISREMARSWHRRIMDGLDVPDPAYIGRYRGEQGLKTCQVRVGPHAGTPVAGVADAQSQFERVLNEVMAELDTVIPAEGASSEDQVNAVLDLCGWVHAEWVRIHPFANGNGRTARLWANFVAVRYGLPPFVRLRPRPAERLYAEASAAAMQGDWTPSAQMMRALLKTYGSDLAAWRRGRGQS